MAKTGEPPARRKRPPCGPFGELRWDEAAGRWRRRLTDAGRRQVEDYLARHPRPGLVLYRIAPAEAGLVFRRYGPDDVHAAAAVGVSDGFSVFDPAVARDGTFIPYYIRSAVHRLLLRRRAGEPETFVSLDAPTRPDGGDLAALVAARPDARPWSAAEWQDALAGLTGQQRQAVLLAHVEGLKPAAAGRRMGVGGGQVRQLLAAAYDRVRVLRPDLAELAHSARDG